MPKPSPFLLAVLLSAPLAAGVVAGTAARGHAAPPVEADLSLSEDEARQAFEIAFGEPSLQGFQAVDAGAGLFYDEGAQPIVPAGDLELSTPTFRRGNDVALLAGPTTDGRKIVQVLIFPDSDTKGDSERADEVARDEPGRWGGTGTRAAVLVDGPERLEMRYQTVHVDLGLGQVIAAFHTTLVNRDGSVVITDVSDRGHRTVQRVVDGVSTVLVDDGDAVASASECLSPRQCGYLANSICALICKVCGPHLGCGAACSAACSGATAEACNRLQCPEPPCPSPPCSPFCPAETPHPPQPTYTPYPGEWPTSPPYPTATSTPTPNVLQACLDELPPDKHHICHACARRIGDKSDPHGCRECCLRCQYGDPAERPDWCAAREKYCPFTDDRCETLDTPTPTATDTPTATPTGPQPSPPPPPPLWERFTWHVPPIDSR